MRILIDECVNPRLAVRLPVLCPAHQIATVRDLGWTGLSDSLLLDRARSHFEVFVTIDKGFAFEHNLRKLSLGIVILDTKNNQMPSYEPVLTELVAAIETVERGRVRKVPGA
jgi:predicted nuclease of predicted toxin-antitoxin system